MALNISNPTALRELRKINYSDRSYENVKAQLQNLIQLYFPNSWTDFSEGNAGQALLEINAYVADILNFYIDKQFNENFIDRAIEQKNIFSLAKGLGYYPTFTKPSVGEISISFDLPATDATSAQMYFKVQANSQFMSNTNPPVIFQNREPIIFDGNLYGDNDTIQQVLNSQNVMVTRITRNNIKITSGQTNSTQVKIGKATTFQRIVIPEQNITEIVSVVDSNGQSWTQVKSLAQEFVYTSIPNITTTSADAPYILSTKRVPYRFTFEQLYNGQGQLTFGSGELNTNEEEFIIGPEDFIMQNKITGKFNDFSPENIAVDDFLNTNALGIAPQNLTFTITYRVGGGLKDNVGSNSISFIKTMTLEYFNSSVNNQTRNQIQNSVIVTNPLQVQGGQDKETNDQIRINAGYNYAAQDRCVTLADYVARISSMPAQFGTIYKAYAVKNIDRSHELVDQISNNVIDLVDINVNAFTQNASMTAFTESKKNQIISLIDDFKSNNANINLYLISQNSLGQLQTTSDVLKKNVLTYLTRFKSVSDILKIVDVNVINIGCRFTIQANVNQYNAAEVLSNCLSGVKNYLSISNMEVSKDIIVTDLIRLLQETTGVLSVPEVALFIIRGTQNGRNYITTDPFVTESQLFTLNGAVFKCPQNTIFECRYTDSDIYGFVTT